MNRTTYANLFAAIGTTYGAGNGTTTFTLPNLKGKVPVGRDSAQTEFDTLGETVSLDGALESTTAPVWLLSIWMIVLGTIFPFVLSLGALRHLPATRVSIVAMLEVVLASVVAWVWLGEALSAAQLAGGGVVIAGVVLAQTSR